MSKCGHSYVINNKQESPAVADKPARRGVIVAPIGKTPSNINEIYTSMKSTFSGLQFCRWQYTGQ